MNTLSTIANPKAHIENEDIQNSVKFNYGRSRKSQFFAGALLGAAIVLYSTDTFGNKQTTIVQNKTSIGDKVESLFSQIGQKPKHGLKYIIKTPKVADDEAYLSKFAPKTLDQIRSDVLEIFPSSMNRDNREMMYKERIKEAVNTLYKSHK